MSIRCNVGGLGMMILTSALWAAGQTGFVPNPVGSTTLSGSLLTATNGITVYVCNQSTGPTCLSPRYSTARSAVDYYATNDPGIDLTVIDEVRGDDITQGEDIFSLA